MQLALAPEVKTCRCGCGREVKPKRDYIKGTTIGCVQRGETWQ